MFLTCDFLLGTSYWISVIWPWFLFSCLCLSLLFPLICFSLSDSRWFKSCCCSCTLALLSWFLILFLTFVAILCLWSTGSYTSYTLKYVRGLQTAHRSYVFLDCEIIYNHCILLFFAFVTSSLIVFSFCPNDLIVVLTLSWFLLSDVSGDIQSHLWPLTAIVCGILKMQNYWNNQSSSQWDASDNVACKLKKDNHRG